MKRFLLSFACILTPLWAHSQEAADTVAPEGSGAGRVETSTAVTHALNAKEAGQPVEAKDWLVVAANPLATEAGARVLEGGGTAADAMVAVQTVLGLVEPQSSGLGGGAFLIWYDATSGEVTTLDGRETAPLLATPTLFQDETGAPLSFFDAVVGGRSVGVPGTPALLEDAHRRWGKSDWPELFNDAIRLAEEGFAVSPRMAGMVAGDAIRLDRFDTTRAYFFPNDKIVQAGHLLKNPDYAETLRLMATQGAAPFYSGIVAQDIVDTVRDAPGNPGVLSAVDMAIYRIKERPPVCAAYRGHQVCGMGPPSSGGLSVGQILGQLEGFDLAGLGPDSPEAWRLFGDSSRLAFADRGRFIADNDFVPVPSGGLLDAAYLAKRADLLRGDDALHEVAPGTPEYDHALKWADDTSIELSSTSHISIVDSYGNALSMTASIENAFGSRLMVRGFLLNNQLTDFSFRSHRDGIPIANAVAPSKRPRSSMAPTIVLKDDQPVLVVGSPGGSRIIGYVAKTIIAHVDWNMDVQQAIAVPHLINRFGTYDIEAGTSAQGHSQALSDMGFEVNPRDLNSGLHAISVGETLKGGADPRREGVALGQ